MNTYFSSKEIPYIKSLQNLQEYKPQKGIKKLFSKKTYPDIYFYNYLDKDKDELSKNSKLIVVGSKRVEEIVKNKYLDKKVELIYPFVKLPQSFSKQQAKQEFCDIQGLRSETKIISFYDNDFKNGGVKEFISMINSLNYKFAKACIIGDSKSLDTVRLFVARLQTKHRFILIEDDKLDDILKASDVFISPTRQKTFHIGVLKAMAYGNVIFTSIDNDVSELLDNFSVMHSHNDMTVLFKVERILQSENDLKLIGEQNAQIVKNIASVNLEEKLKL